MVIPQAQLRGGANHASGLNTPNLGGLQGFVSLSVGVVDVSSDLGETDILASGHVGGAADHLHLLRTDGDHTKAQPVSVEVRTHVFHMADKYPGPTANDIDLTDLNACHGQTVSQLMGWQINVHILFKPTNGYFHL